MAKRVRLRVGAASGGGGGDVTLPEAPRSTVDTTYSLPTGGTTWTVNDGDDLQAVFNSVQPGDVIVMEAGAEWRGNYEFPKKTGTGDIYIISSALASLPAYGTRVAPSDASNMPRIATPTIGEAGWYLASRHALIIEQEVDNLRFVGIELGSNYTETTNVQYGVIRVGQNADGSTVDYTLTTCDNIIFDRCYIHGTDTANNRDGVVAYHVSTLAFIECYISAWHGIGYESHGLHLYTPTGPTKVSNCYIEAAGINVFVGDSTLPVNAPVPADLEIVDNYIFKPLTWKPSDPSYAGINWLVKNLLEFKCGDRAIVKGNVLENCWIDGQTGPCFVTKATATHLNDILMENNITIDSHTWFQISDQSDGINRFAIINNLFKWVQEADRDSGWALASLVDSGAQDITFSHNTIMGNTMDFVAAVHSALIFNGNSSLPSQVNRISFVDNLMAHGLYGIFGNANAAGFSSVDYYCSNYKFNNNVLIETPPIYLNSYDDSPGFINFHLDDTLADIKFVDTAFDNVPGDFALQATSPYKNNATDGTDVGVDTTKLPAHS